MSQCDSDVIKKGLALIDNEDYKSALEFFEDAEKSF